jgi:hypothetical protein
LFCRAYVLTCGFLTVPVMTRCRGSRTVKRVKAPWLGNTVAMTVYDVRIVKARGRQPWHGQDRKDERHPTLLFGVTHPSHSTTRVQAFHASLKMLRECCPLSTGLEQLASTPKSYGPRPPVEGRAGAEAWGSLKL